MAPRSRINGARELRRLYKGLPDRLKNRIIDVQTNHVRRVWIAGKANIQTMTERRSGKLEDNYKRKIQIRKDRVIGQVGYLSAKDRRETYYARWVHDGTSKLAARPFHDLAVRLWDRAYRQEMRQAVRLIIDDIRGARRLKRLGIDVDEFGGE